MDPRNAARPVSNPLMRVLLVVLVACADPPTPPPPLPPPVAPVTPPELHVLGDALCAASTCWRIGEGELRTKGSRSKATPIQDPAQTFALAGERCTLGIDRVLVCAGKPRATEVQLLRGNVLVGRDLVAAFGDYDAPERLAPLALPPHLRQVSIAVGVGCALTESGEVWCWSDPAKPRKREVPRDVVDLAVLDPFALCVRTRGGEVSCTPPIAASGDVLCAIEGRTCRLRATYGGPKGKPFDPLTPLLQPLVDVPFGFAAQRFTRDEYEVMPIVPDLTESMFDDPHVGGCAVGPAGQVACVLSCGTRGVYAVTMPPVVDIRVDRASGYGLTASGELWTWPRIPASCMPDNEVFSMPATVTATKSDLGPVHALSSLLHYVGRRKFGAEVRCASLRDGAVRCWEAADGPAVRFDPAAR